MNTDNRKKRYQRRRPKKDFDTLAARGLNLSLLPNDVLFIIFGLLYDSLNVRQWLPLRLVNIRCRKVIDTFVSSSIRKQYPWNISFARNDLPPSFSEQGGPVAKQLVASHRAYESWHDRLGQCDGTTPIMRRYDDTFIPKLRFCGDDLVYCMRRDLYYVRPDGKYRNRFHSRKWSSPHSSDITDFVWSEGGIYNEPGPRIATSSADGGIHICNPQDGSTRPLSGHTGLVRCLDSKRGLLASGSNDGTVKLWRWSDTSFVSSIDFHDRVWTLSFSSDAVECLVATTGFNRKGVFLTRFDVESGRVTDYLQGHRSTVYDVKLLPENSTMVALNLDDPNDYPTYCAVYNGDYRVVTGSSNYCAINTWDIRKTREPVSVRYLEGQKKGFSVHSMQTDSASLFVGVTNEMDNTESEDVSSLIVKSTEEIDELSNLIISLLTAISQRDLPVVSSHPSEVLQKIAQIKTLMTQLTDALEKPHTRDADITEYIEKRDRLRQEVKFKNEAIHTLMNRLRSLQFDISGMNTFDSKSDPASQQRT
ncbi:hypothetical protein PROFUN_09502 [Planoprotostelium fungivorum]|uniref:Uncharacterized protein n=1 Tax=Planoprotostelium fungivorum TaxID=1890364 RepID=A0A2P6NH51_9EUKA|nr:hypothetical protein PROFUN_09502 [Planoprotostelium fungivorum]